MTQNLYQPSNLNSSGANKTTNFFNNYFSPDFTISENMNDAIVSFFQEQTGSKDSALLLAQAVINTAQQQNEDPMVVLEQFQKMPQGEMSAIMALYLNNTRVSTSLLGIKNVPKANKFVSRTIKA